MELRCDNIQYSIEGSRILNGISLGVSNNEFHTILGPNGCGKTTFLKTVYRITKPDLGAIYLDGKPLDNISIRKVHRIWQLLHSSIILILTVLCLM